MKYTTNINYTLKDIEFENEFFADSKIITNEDMERRIVNIMAILLKDILFEGNYINTFYDATTDKEYFVYKDGPLVEIQELNDKNKYLSFKLSFDEQRIIEDIDTVVKDYLEKLDSIL